MFELVYSWIVILVHGEPGLYGIRKSKVVDVVDPGWTGVPVPASGCSSPGTVELHTDDLLCMRPLCHRSVLEYQTAGVVKRSISRTDDQKSSYLLAVQSRPQLESVWVLPVPGGPSTTITPVFNV